MNLSIKLSGLLLVTSMMLSSSAETHDKKHEKVKYVQGGACEGGNGSKKHPFNNLKDAEAADWDVLIVLSSTTALDGGITLKDGQKLIGEENPTDISLSPTQPTITNTDLSGNNQGNGVIVNGDATIENIYFKDTQASAIQYNDGKDLTVKNVLITGYGQGANDDISDFGGISGSCENSGETHISKVIILDSANTIAGPGILNEAKNGAHRELLVCTSEFAGLRGVGILSNADGKGTTSTVHVKNTFMHDFIGDERRGINCCSLNGAEQKVLVKDSRFSTIGSADGVHISCTALQGDAILKLKIDSCLFEEALAKDPVAVEIINCDGALSTEMAVERSVINFSQRDSIAFRSTIFVGTQTLHVSNNKVTLGDDGIFYIARSEAGRPGDTNVEIKDNFFTGSTAISIAAFAPWNKLKIDATHNCFQGDGTAAAFQNAEGVAGNNATLRAHKNSISGFIPDIEGVSNAGVFYDVTKNWWGHVNNVPCTPGPCQPFQTCVGVTCKGPLVDGTTNVDASDPLIAPIKCPHNCCQPLPAHQP